LWFWRALGTGENKSWLGLEKKGGMWGGGGGGGGGGVWGGC